MSADKEYTITIHFTGTLEAAEKFLDALVKFTRALFFPLLPSTAEVVGFSEDKPQEVSDEPPQN